MDIRETFKAIAEAAFGSHFSLGTLLLSAVMLLSINATPAQAASFTQDGLTYDLGHVYDAALRTQILAALGLGYQAKAQGGKSITRVIANLRGNGTPRVVHFYSNEAEQNPGSVSTGAPASAIWTGPHGIGDFTSPPSTRTDLRIFIAPGQPYWYLVNSVWHELLHTTLGITHHQTTPEGVVPASYVNDAVWYTTIHSIMLNFPTHAKNPITGQSEELYNTDDSPWS